MGILNGLLGNATEVKVEDLQKELNPILADGESIEMAYKVLRDMYVFTNKRLLLIDKQGLTGKKVDYHTIPYKSISHFAVETAGHFDMDAELKIWISSSKDPIIKTLKKGTDVVGIQKAMANFMFN
ncbi:MULTISPECIES: PH domain-containing protein [Desulfobacula]|uniref:PH domain-containing protein n=1 Tax=Desulfobacula phenolica TaxID=90732 RepID=A0A1H2H3J9_9BACT|nr:MULTISPECIES: PH domain-containing protein [Desulfobacula]SDU26460.1 PH domain-containing protein [Desulfobacula phenolica]